MADTPRSTGTGDDTGVEHDRGATTGTSRWQKVVGIIGLLVVLFVGSQMAGNLLGRSPGPGDMRHRPGQDAPPAELQEPEADTGDGGHAPPEGGHG